jgi:hypothetical protein
MEHEAEKLRLHRQAKELLAKARLGTHLLPVAANVVHKYWGGRDEEEPHVERILNSLKDGRDERELYPVIIAVPKDSVETDPGNGSIITGFKEGTVLHGIAGQHRLRAGTRFLESRKSDIEHAKKRAARLAEPEKTNLLAVVKDFEDFVKGPGLTWPCIVYDSGTAFL